MITTEVLPDNAHLSFGFLLSPVFICGAASREWESVIIQYRAGEGSVSKRACHTMCLERLMFLSSTCFKAVKKSRLMQIEKPRQASTQTKEGEPHCSSLHVCFFVFFEEYLRFLFWRTLGSNEHWLWVLYLGVGKCFNALFSVLLGKWEQFKAVVAFFLFLSFLNMMHRHSGSGRRKQQQKQLPSLFLCLSLLARSLLLVTETNSAGVRHGRL